MTPNSPFFRSVPGRTVVLCALVLLFSPDTASSYENDPRLAELSQRYLETLKRQSKHLPSEQRTRLEKQARRTIAEGFAKLKRDSFPVTKNHSPSTALASLQTLDRSGETLSVQKAAKFLRRNDRTPPKTLLTFHRSLPYRFCETRRLETLARLRPHEPSRKLPLQDEPLCVCASTITSSPTRSVNCVAKLDHETTFVSFSLVKEGSHANENILHGFQTLARTIVLQV